MKNWITLISFLMTLVWSSCNRDQKADSVATSVKDTLKTDTLSAGAAYTRDCKAYYQKAKEMDSLLMQETDVVPATATHAIKAFTDFAYYCASDSLSPVYLIKTAQVARAVNNIPQARLALDRCIEHYPSFNNRAAALFMLAQLYDEPTYQNDEHQARKIYQNIIDEYPKSVWADNARAAMTLLGKSDKEIIESFKNKHKN
ncbi:MAG TPA: tetratricopeptide repeat protein [Bacteroidia bacterium]|nr:tetratricopeptide repeat protein [Bacteroidia bacterium]